MSYTVLLPDFDPGNLETLGKPVADAYGILPADARLRMRQGWGFLDWGSSLEHASETANKIMASGARARAVEISALRGPGEPELMSGFAVSPEGFLPEVRTPDVVSRTIPWNEIAIVAAGGFSNKIVRRESIQPRNMTAGMINMGITIATGIPVGLGKARKKEKNKSAKDTLFVSFGQIVTKRSESYFFNADSINFIGLGEAKQMSSSRNYRALIALLAQRSSARLNMGARCIVEKRGMSAANYESVEGFERELLWMLNSD